MPKGQWIIIGIFAMHRNPKHWKDADKFVPERWIQGTTENKDLPANAYIPFGDGPRACVGGKFALQEAKHTLLLMFQKVYLELAPCQSRVSLCSTPPEAPNVFVQNDRCACPLTFAWIL